VSDEAKVPLFEHDHADELVFLAGNMLEADSRYDLPPCHYGYSSGNPLPDKSVAAREAQKKREGEQNEGWNHPL